ncbi:MAG: hypothetical protein IJ195_08825 [Lachnospiraceae bacterium]|nr:hypothetical protein [Lachnospiraceae bacterium]
MRKFYGKLITFTLISAMVLGLAGCTEKEVSSSEPTVSETVVASTSETSVSTETSVSSSEIPEILPETDTSENDKEEKAESDVVASENENPLDEIKEEDDKKFYSGTLTEMDKKFYVIKEVNAKTLPGQTGEVVRTLPVGTEVHVVGKDVDTGWYCLEDGTFVSSSSTYLSTTKPKEQKQEASTSTSTGNQSGSSNSSSASTGNSSSSASTSTEAQNSTPAPTPEPIPQVCQHTSTEERVYGNTGREVGGGCGQSGTIYHTFCKNCGADLGNERTEWGAINHAEHSEVIIDDYGECGGSGTSHVHHYCGCGAINYDDAPVTSPNPHSMRTIQYYDGDGNLVETNQCAFCGWEDGSDHIVQYASGD